ncbi:zinc-binding alcohol dehydrogenase family protein [Salibacterium aidingense]|uniref:zinc-binding alcohol dehydrogenase family protein n=1 Tax=Salibacterium aidingense TaxID=384933 RepID=UPI003BDA75DD
MKQIVCQEPNVLEEKHTALPTIQEKEILLKIKRIGICGTDLHAYKGNQPFFQYPRVLGHEISGEIEEPNGFTAFKKGDRAAVIPYIACGSCHPCLKGKRNCCQNLEVIGVHRDGGMSEYLAVPAENIILTNDLSFEEAALLEPLSIGMHAITRSRLQKDDTVVVIGAGPIGLGAGLFAKQNGNKVIILDQSRERLQFAKKWTGADDIITVDGTAEKALQNKADIVFDATGSRQSMIQAFEYVSYGGTLVYVGLVKDNITFFDPDFHKKEITLMGSRNARLEDFKKVKQAIQNGSVGIESYTTHRISFDKLKDEYQSLYHPKENMIKALVTL